MSFKDLVAFDLATTFLNLEEFGVPHRIDGATVTCIFDDDALKERQGGQELGVAESSLLLLAAVKDLPERRPAGQGLNVDGKEYIINDWAEDMGLATIALGQNISL